MIKTRIEQEANYKSIWCNGKTLRFAIDPTRPITKLQYPEFLDIKITGHCEGNCPYCYMDSKELGKHPDHIVQKIRDYFCPMTANQRPYQVALGGGEPTSHPEFVELLRILKNELDICPNYTTNGMFIRDFNRTSTILASTFNYCGGVAISCHPHLTHYWTVALEQLARERNTRQSNLQINLHVIISDDLSIDYFAYIYHKYSDIVNYFVLLPYGAQGRAEPKEINWNYLVKILPEDQSKIAFGANFYPYLSQGGHGIHVSLYEPEIMSGFLDLETMKLHPSSFNLTEER